MDSQCFVLLSVMSTMTQPSSTQHSGLCTSGQSDGVMFSQQSKYIILDFGFDYIKSLLIHNQYSVCVHSLKMFYRWVPCMFLKIIAYITELVFLQKHEPDLWIHLLSCEIQPTRVVFRCEKTNKIETRFWKTLCFNRWIMRGFSGHFPPSQLLYLWDLVLAYDSMEVSIFQIGLLMIQLS